jgi:type I restriction enzyme S subunit
VRFGLLKNLKLPVPPLPVQEEIVRILDEFTELEVELEAELEARTKQYEYYRNTLLDFSTGKVGFPKIDQLLQKYCPDGVDTKLLRDVSIEMFRGQGIKRNQVTTDGVPCIRYGEIYTTYNLSFKNAMSYTTLEFVNKNKYAIKGDLLFAITGEKTEEIGKAVTYLGDDKLYVGGDIVLVRHSLSPKYLAYLMDTEFLRKQKSFGKTKSKVVHMSMNDVGSLMIPVPPKIIQQEIVRILDEFSEYTTSLTKGLPAEIDLRKKQYEYYRNQLLTF